jgi:hypothetical protein
MFSTLYHLHDVKKERIIVICEAATDNNTLRHCPRQQLLLARPGSDSARINNRRSLCEVVSQLRHYHLQGFLVFLGEFHALLFEISRKLVKGWIPIAFDRLDASAPRVPRILWVRHPSRLRLADADG